MKKVLFILILIASLSILVSVESDPSETVGYVKYDMLPGLNLVAMPMDDGMTLSSEVGAYIDPTMDPLVLDTINLWDAATQTWNASVNYGGGFWFPDNPVATGSVLYLNTSLTASYYSIGDMPLANAQYSFLPGLNTAMLPLNKSALSLTSAVGADIDPTLDPLLLDTINLWDASTQTWNAAVNYGGGFWFPDNPVSIGTPMYLNTSLTTTWPAGPRGTTGLSAKPSTSRK